MAYVYLLAAIASEVLGTSLIKSTDGFTRPWQTAACLSAYGVAFFALARAVQAGMHVGVGYALWSALGTAAITLIGVTLLGEPVNAATVAGVTLVIAGVVVLNLGGAH